MTLGKPVRDILFENEVNQRKLLPFYDFCCILMIILRKGRILSEYVFSFENKNKI